MTRLALFLILSLALGVAQASTPDLATDVTLHGVSAHMAAFQRIATAHGGNRAAATPGYAASLRYVEGALREAGYTVTRQPFDIETTRTLAETGRVLGSAPLELRPIVMEGSPNTPAGGLRATLAVPQDKLGCEPDEFVGVEGKVVLLERGVCTFGQKAANAAAAGAVATLVANNEPGPLYASLGDVPDTTPTAAVTYELGQELRNRLEGGVVRVRLELRSETMVQTTANLLAEWPGAREGRVVMVGAHLDSVPAGPGINDNGSGSALVLELALGLAREGDASGARFAFWGAEELGLLGSRHYIANLGPDDLQDIRAYLNFDMVSSPNAALFTYGDPELTTLFQRSLRQRGLPAATTDLGGSSDHAPFSDAGVPVAGLFTGASGDKSPGQARAYGGRAQEPFDPCYHQACDTFRDVNTPVSSRVLERTADAAADTLHALLERH